MLRPTVDFKEFTNHPADWADANRALHALAVIAGCVAETAVSFSMHSARHVYPTCAFQLLFPPPAVTLMGHWALKDDKMAANYDGQRTATELAYKANVCVQTYIEGGAQCQMARCLRQLWSLLALVLARLRCHSSSLPVRQMLCSPRWILLLIKKLLRRRPLLLLVT